MTMTDERRNLFNNGVNARNGNARDNLGLKGKTRCKKHNNPVFCPMTGASTSCFFGTKCKCKEQLGFSETKYHDDKDDDQANHNDYDADDDEDSERVALVGGQLCFSE